METERRHEISQWIKTRASELGFAACGIVEAAYLENDADRLNHWLEQGYQGEMEYMARNVDKRTDPGKLVPGARSVIVMLMNYFPEENLPEKDNYKIAKYAYGKDYHLVIREKLNRLMQDIKDLTGEFEARAFTDSAPVLERALAEKAGLGWIGKNTCLIHPKLGSFLFICEIITNLQLEYDRNQVNDLCGGCTRCIDACPTTAITAPRQLDARKCISYHTIEYRGDLPFEEKDHFKDWIFGCDICQDVCPWNRKSIPNQETDFQPGSFLLEMNKGKWQALTPGEFDIYFRESALKRTRYEGLKRNISFLSGKEI